jgi:hypothetical protein
LNGEDASGRVSGLSEILTGMIRAAVAGVTAGRPVLGLVAPPVRVRVEPAGADTVVWIDTTSDGIGVGRLLGRCLRRNVEDELAALLDHDLPIDSAALLLPRDLSDAQMDLLAGSAFRSPYEGTGAAGASPGTHGDDCTEAEGARAAASAPSASTR